MLRIRACRKQPSPSRDRGGESSPQIWGKRGGFGREWRSEKVERERERERERLGRPALEEELRGAGRGWERRRVRRGRSGAVLRRGGGV